MSELKITNSGINFLDNLLGDGFLSNSIIVISHQPGSKIRHLGLQIGLNKFNEKFHLINVTKPLAGKPPTSSRGDESPKSL